jgi:hypothetical protein
VERRRADTAVEFSRKEVMLFGEWYVTKINNGGGWSEGLQKEEDRDNA